MLLEYADNLPPLPAELQDQADRAAHRIAECQTPVFIWADVVDGRVQLAAEVAPEAPTVKGFVSILIDLFAGVPVEQALAMEGNVVGRLGLLEALGMMRMRGLQAMQFYIRNRIRATPPVVEWPATARRLAEGTRFKNRAYLQTFHLFTCLVYAPARSPIFFESSRQTSRVP